jgi:hypothetical protein
MTFNALDLEAAIAAMTPADTAAIAAATPVGYADQLTAATEQTETATMAAISEPVEFAVPEWMSLLMLEALSAWDAGTARLCQHRPSLLAPQPVTAVSWHRNAIACRECAPLLDAGCAQQCDACGSDAEMQLVATCIGCLTHWVRLCEHCSAELSR